MRDLVMLRGRALGVLANLIGWLGQRPGGRAARRVAIVVTLVALLGGMVNSSSWAGQSSTPVTPRQLSGTGRANQTGSAIRAGHRGARASAAPGALPPARTPVLPARRQKSNADRHATVSAPQPPRTRQPAAHVTSTEILAKRTANASVFQNSDGTRTAHISSAPVHYRLPDGSWAAIDTTLVRTKTGSWQEKANSPTPTFAANGNSPNLVSIPLAGGTSMSFGIQGAANVAGSASGNDITYHGIEPDADANYAVSAVGVKETLTLDNAQAPDTWTFPLTLRGLHASAKPDGSIALLDAHGHVVDTITSGYMEDSNVDPRANQGVRSTGVTYQLITVNGGPALRVTLDSAWVHDPKRVFPIKVDPTSLNSDGSTYVQSPGSADNSGDDVLQVGTYDGGANIANSYLMFDVGGAFTNDYIEQATLYLYDVHSYTCTPEPVYLSPITTPWSVTGAKTYPWVAYGAPLASNSFAAGYAPGGCGNPQWEPIDLGDHPWANGTQLLESWAHGGQNHGLALTADAYNSLGYKEFASAASPANQPFLSITYSPYGADYSVSDNYVQPTGLKSGSQQVTVTNRGTTAWTPGSESLSFQLYDMNWNHITTNAAGTPLPGTVAPNATTTINGIIPPLTPGQYILCWDMYVGSTSFELGYGVPTATCDPITSANTPPVIDSTNPPSNITEGTLTPQLFATGHDPDNYPGKGLTYDFQVYTVPSDGSTPALAADSGWIAANNWVVPSGKLSWNQNYYWIVADNDSLSQSQWTQPSVFLTAVPQPLITSHLGRKASNKDFDPGVGDYTTTATDASVPGVGPALAITRSYNSLDPRTGSLFGAGWSTTYDMSVAPDNDGSGDVVVTYADGHTVRFGLNADGTTFTPPSGMYATLQTVTAGGYTLTDNTGTTYHFTDEISGVWRLSTIADADGHTESLTYNKDSTLATITNTTTARSLTLGWSGGHVTTVTTNAVTPFGQPLTWTYGYTGNTLTSVCSPLSTSRCTTYGYTTGAGSGSHYRSAVLDANPYAYWRLNDAASTTTAGDQVAANLGTKNGTYNVAFAHGAGPLPGSPSTSSYFGGGGEVTLPNGLITSSGQDMTLELWFQTTAGGPLFGYQSAPIGQTQSTAVPALYIGTDGKLRGELWPGADQTGQPAAPITSGGVVNDNRWHQVVLTEFANTQTLYLDGSVVGTANGPVQPLAMSYDQIGAAATDPPSAWPSWGSATTQYFTGNIADVAFYTHLLGQPAITQQYTAGSQPAQELAAITTPNGVAAAKIGYDDVNDRTQQVTDVNGGNWTIGTPATSGSSADYRGAALAAHPMDFWPFGESGGTLAVDAIPQGRVNGSGGPGLYDDVTLGTTGPFAGVPDTSASFNGTDSTVTMPHFVDPASANGQAAIGLWFQTGTAGGVLAEYNNKPLLYVGTDGKLYGDFGGVGQLRAGAVTDGKWHFAVLTAGLDSNNARNETLYLDGARAATVSGLVGAPVSDAALEIGAGAITGSAPAAPAANPNGYFTGAIADVAIYDTNLPAATVTALNTAAKATANHPTPITVVAVTDPGTRQLSYTYDPDNAGRLVASTDGLGNTTSFAYDSSGFLDTTTEPDGDYTSKTHNTRGDVLSKTVGDSHGNSATSYYTYPAAGTYAATDPRDDKPLTFLSPNTAGPTDTTHRTSYTYTATGDLLTTTAPDNAVTTNTYTNGTEPAFDGNGNQPAGLLAETKDAMGYVTTYSYNANGDLAQQKSPLGLVTSYGYDNLGRRTSQKQVSDTFPNGLTTTYTYDGTNRPLTRTDPGATDAVTGTTHTLLTTDTYDADGDPLTTTQSDTTGGDKPRTTTYTYNGDDQLATETDPANRVTTYKSYDAYGNPTLIVDPAGDDYAFTYDDNGNQRTETLDGWTGNTATPAAPQNILLDQRTYDPDGLLATDTDAMNWQTTYTYDYAHRELTRSLANFIEGQRTVTLPLDTYGYDADGNQLSSQQADGEQIISQYDPTDRLDRQTVDPTGPIDRVTTYGYDNDNQLTSRTVANGPVAEETDYSYDALGDRLSQEVHGSGSTAFVTLWTYDERGLPLTMTDPRGYGTSTLAAQYTTDYTHDARGRLATTIAPPVNTETNGGTPVSTRPVTEAGYDTYGDQTSTSDADGNITSDTYDPDGELIGVSAPAYTPPGSTTAITPTATAGYTALGQLETSTDGQGNTTTNTYDQLGDLVQVTGPAVNGQTPTSQYTFDNNGEQLSATDPTGAQTQATYDALGEPITATQLVRQPTPTADTTDYGYDPSSYPTGDPATVTNPTGQVITVGYDHAGDRTSVIDPTGDTTSYTYDADLHLTKITLPDGTANTASYDPAGRQTGTAQLDATGKVLSTTATGYDANNNPTSATDANNVTTTATFDAANHLVQQVQPVTASSDITTSYGYDAAGRLTRSTDGDGNPTIYTYNPLGLRESTIAPTIPGLTTPAQTTTTVGYDADGRPVRVTRPGGVSQTFGYDPLGNMTSEVGAGAEAATLTRTLGHDLDSRLTSVSTPTGTDTLTYDDRGNVLSSAGTAGTASFSYDTDGRLATRTDASGTATFTYDLDSRLATDTDPLTRTTATYGYNPDSQVTSIGYGANTATQTNKYYPQHTLQSQTLTNPAGNTEASIAYGYDNDGHTTSETTTGIAGAAANTYTYDDAGRLSSWQAGGNTTTYGYDNDSNRTQAGASTATYNAQDEVTSTTTGGTTTTYGYTPRGTLATRTTGATTTTNTDDAFDQLAATTSAGTTTAYGHDALGRLTSAGTNTFSYDGTNTSPAADGSQSFQYTPAGRLTSEQSGSTAAQTLTDNHGNVTALYPATGSALTGSAGYAPYGQHTATTGSQSDLGYQGGWTDPATGDIATASRWYDPATGTFTSHDATTPPIGSASAAANPYLYANADPLDKSDPSGHSPCEPSYRDGEGEGGWDAAEFEELLNKLYEELDPWEQFDEEIVNAEESEGPNEGDVGDESGGDAAEEGGGEPAGGWDGEGNGLDGDGEGLVGGVEGGAGGGLVIETYSGCESAVPDEPAEPSAEDLARRPSSEPRPQGQAPDGKGGTPVGNAPAPNSGPGEGSLNTGVVAEPNPELVASETSYSPASQATAEVSTLSPENDIELSAEAPQAEEPEPTAEDPSLTSGLSPPEDVRVPQEEADGLSSAGSTDSNGKNLTLYRSMINDNGKPKIEPRKRALGATIGGKNPDIVPDENGMVYPGQGGMSTSPDTPWNLVEPRRPAAFGGKGKDPVWSIGSDELPEGLNPIRDKPTHVTIEPAWPMHIDDFQSLLASTQNLWKLVTDE
jgi:RHS repeat-associated protein